MRIEEDQRLDWPDLAKAICISLVVLMHCSSALSREIWEAANIGVKPLRMPLFFLVSGLLASNSIVNPKDDTLHKRFHRPLYLYLLWGAILSASILFRVEGDFPYNPMTQIGLKVGLIDAASWYMLALAVFYLFTKMTLRIPLGPVIILCAALSLLGTIYQDVMIGNQHKLYRCLIFFVLGARMKNQWMAFANAASVPRTIMLGGGFLLGSAALYGTDIYVLPVDLVAVAFGVSLCQIIAMRWSAVMTPARWIGKRTLPIYLIHFILIEIIYYVVSKTIPRDIIENRYFILSFPVILTPILIAMSIYLYKIIVSLKMFWLFDLPFKRRVGNIDGSPLLVGR